jgi:hypothetical protein
MSDNQYTEGEYIWEGKITKRRKRNLTNRRGRRLAKRN